MKLNTSSLKHKFAAAIATLLVALFAATALCSPTAAQQPAAPATTPAAAPTGQASGPTPTPETNPLSAASRLRKVPSQPVPASAARRTPAPTAAATRQGLRRANAAPQKQRPTPVRAAVKSRPAPTANANSTVPANNNASALAAPSVAPASNSDSDDSTESRRILREDVLSILVVDHPELSNAVNVLTDGTIHYPFLGENSELYVVGLTITDLQKKIAKALSKQYVRPQVVVNITSNAVRTMTILGSGVRVPGPKVMREGWRVLDAFAEVGGLPLPDRPELFRATLFRKNGTESVTIDLKKLVSVDGIDQTENRKLQKGDILLIEELTPDRTQITVLGQVAKPGPQLLAQDGSLLRAINGAGGPTPLAQLSTATITRNGQVTTVDLRPLLKTGIEPEGVRLQAGDTLTLPENKKRYFLLAPVQTPGAIVYPDDEELTLFSAVTRAGIQPQSADFKNTVLIKANPDGTEKSREKLNIDPIFKEKRFELDRPLEVGDIVYIPTKTPKQPLRLIDALNYLPFAGFVLQQL